MPTAKLKTYKTKRDFRKTPEPSGKTKASRSKHLYLIQKHAASHLHYDFRLEISGVLKSWAVPKGPSLDPTIKRLAVHVEDHPIEYGSFEGIIPEGEYGGGTVMLWDKGEWESEEPLVQAYRKGHMTFTLKGKKLKGLWKLIQIKKNPKNWLLMKLLDKYARSEKDYNIEDAEPLSAASHRTMQEIAENAAKVWNSNKTRSKKSTGTKKVSHSAIAALSAAKKGAMPTVVYPELATLVDSAPRDNNWLHEIKFDGYRLICFLRQNKVKVMTRNQNDWTHKVPAIVGALQALSLNSAILDGELVALDEESKSNFQILQNTLHKDQQAPLYFYVFDILYCDGYDLTNTPLLERKKLLKQLIPTGNSIIRYSDHVIGQGPKVFTRACKLGGEGIVSKEIQSRYQQKRTQDWLKVKCVKRQEFVIGGYTQPRGSRKYFGSLLIGVFSDKGLQYCGHVGTGFNEISLKNIYQLLQKNTTSQMPFTQRPPKISDVHWVKPKIVIEVEFIEWTQEGILRHPSFKGIRKDKPANKVNMETLKSLRKVVMAPKNKTPVEYNFTNPGRVLYPKDGITKQDLGDFYQSISSWILPYIVDRPLTLVRCPEGEGKECFYQKHLKEKSIPGLYTIDIKEKNKTEKYIYIQDLQGLLALVQLGVLEIHPWGCRIEEVENPDLIVFDLDPAPDVEWKKVIAAAKHLRDQLAKIKLKSFVKTSGGKGLHLVVPIKPIYSWSDMVNFAHAFTDVIVAQNPDIYIGTMSKAKRTGKIFIDYLRNNRGSTTVAAYSTRAKPGAPVSTPLSWKELTPRIKANSYNLHNLPNRLVRLKIDPWKGFFKLKQKLPGI